MLTYPQPVQETVTIDNQGQLAAWYDRHYAEHGFWHTPPEAINEHWQRIVEARDRVIPERVLDIGCGDARHYEWFHEHALKFEYHGLDPSKFAIEVAMAHISALPEQEKNPATFYIAAAEEIPLRVPGEYYDVATAFGSIEHVVDLTEAFAGVKHCLKPGGLFYLFVPNEKWTHRDQPNERAFDEALWIDYLAVAGFTLVKVWNHGDCSAILMKKP